MDGLLITVELPKEDGCCDGGYTIGCSNAYPHAVGAPNLRENEQERHEEDELAADGHENAPFRHPDALEKVASHNLETHNGREANDDSHS